MERHERPVKAQPLSGDDISKIIKAGFKANAEKIEYNNLIITYKTPFKEFMVPNTTLVDEKPSLQVDEKSQAIQESLEDKIFTDPVAYELES